MKVSKVLDLAYKSLGIPRWQFDLQPDEIQDALDVLRLMMAGWSTQGIRCGFNEAAGLDDESGLPTSVVQSVYTNLAVLLAPGFGKTISPALASQANDGYENALVQFSMIIPQKLPRMLPAGAGNKYWRGYNLVYPERNPPAIDAGSDSTLEL